LGKGGGRRWKGGAKKHRFLAVALQRPFYESKGRGGGSKRQRTTFDTLAWGGSRCWGDGNALGFRPEKGRNK